MASSLSQDLWQSHDDIIEESISNKWELKYLLDSNELLSLPMAGWKKYARIILPHIGLIILSILYIIGGALAFYHLEQPNEIAIRRESLREISVQKKQMLEELWKSLNDETISDEEIKRLAIYHVDNVTRLLFEAFDTHYISASHLQSTTSMFPNEYSDVDCSWTFTTALFFTATLLTTIDNTYYLSIIYSIKIILAILCYGNLVPVTFQGRMFCIIYALFGVPLILITVADIGKFLSENIVWIYSKYGNKKKKVEGYETTDQTYRQSNDICVMSITTDISTTMKDQLLQFGLERYITIPIFLIVGMLLGYITVGAILLGFWEHWDFFSGFYFSFITMMTVGFGDIVPVKQEYYLFDLLYIIVGLAITTMCVDLVGIQYIRKIHYFGRAIKDARYALVNVGGRMVHIPDLMRYASVLHQKYGEKRQGRKIRLKGAYVPEDLPLIRYIDYGSLASGDFDFIPDDHDKLEERLSAV